MWIFGYGSLMSDKWEEKLGCVRRAIAVLPGYQRVFNKASIENWGSKETPCPTLSLEQSHSGECKGIAFEFPGSCEAAVRKYLAVREGKGFPLEEVTIRLENGSAVVAYTPIYRGKNLVAGAARAKAQMIVQSKGERGSCHDYVKGIAELLSALGIGDPAVSSLWAEVQKALLDSTVSELCERLESLDRSLPRRVEGYALSPDSKLPMKALVYREVLIWRMTELSRSAMENLEKENLSVAVTLIRAALETTAGLWYLKTKLDHAVTSQSQGDIDEYLMKLIMGTKTEPEMPQAINVLTFIDRINKDIEGFRGQYDHLSEFAHPNWAGTSLLYSKPDQKNLWTDFGKNIRGLNSTKQAGALNLSVALMIFEKTYNRIADLMPAFIKLCSRPETASAALK